MWVPRSAEEVEEAARSGALSESSSFDTKADLPQQKKNVELAKDVAAMATDGGVLLYGVGEDDLGNPTMPHPIALAGVTDRVGQIVATSIVEVPFVDPRPLPCESDPSRGYLAVVVPQSARAPHMVVVNGENRYYGRTATGNRILSEGDVARLYERRGSWEVDRDALLTKIIEQAPVRRRADRGYVHAYARPVVLDRELLERAQAVMGDDLLPGFLSTARTTVLRGDYGPSLRASPYLRRHGGDMWRWATLTEEEIDAVSAQVAETRFDPTDLVVVDLNLDGRGQMFCGRATDNVRDDPTERLLFEVVVAETIEVFLAVMSALYEAAGYHGAVDVGVAVTNVRGARSARQERNFGGRAYPIKDYKRTRRVAAAELKEATVIGQRLLGHFFEATTGLDGYNPWTDAQYQRP